MQIAIVCEQCDWRQDDLTNEELEQWVDKPCPQCGNIVVTLEDFKATQTVEQMSDVLHKLRDTSGQQLDEYKVSPGGLERYEGQGSVRETTTDGSGSGSSNTNCS